MPTALAGGTLATTSTSASKFGLRLSCFRLSGFANIGFPHETEARGVTLVPRINQPNKFLFG